MAAFETYSKRLKREQSDAPRVWEFENIPREFRVQVIHVWREAMGCGTPGTISESNWSWIHTTLSKELGVFRLSNSRADYESCCDYILSAPAEGVLDIIEISLRVIDVIVRDTSNYVRQMANIRQDPDDAIEEVNHRFKEHALGYHFEERIIIRVDSEYLHAEAIEPALKLLHVEGFTGPLEEFLRAHEHFRHRRYKEAVVDALKSFESTMKAIYDARGWHYEQTAPAKQLLNVAFQHNLIPSYMQSHLTGLRTVLEAGVPTLRNKTSGHGQGATPIDMPEHYVGYALNLAASNIVFLITCHQAT